MPSKKRYPVQRKIGITQSPGPAANSGVIQCATFLSKINHRLYRQSRTYEAKINIDGNLADATTVDVYALADTWWLQGALKLARKAWEESNAEEIAMNNGHVARWNDFRVEADLPGGFADLVPTLHSRIDLSTVQYVDGEFDFSTVVDQAGVSRTFCLGPPSATQYNIFDEYANQPGTSADPEFPSTGPYSGLLPNLDAQAAAAISDEGNHPPYKADGFESGIWVKVGTLHLATGRQTVSTGFFKAPLGLIALEGIATITPENAVNVSVEMKGGDYKGVMSHSMLE